MRAPTFHSACALLLTLGAVSCDHPDAVKDLIGQADHGGTGSSGDQACGGPADHSCGAKDFCDAPTGTCGKGEGVCRARPEVCPALYSPVCGCDGKTYGNDCERQAAGVGKASDGACAPTEVGEGESCGGFVAQPPQCKKGLVCLPPPGKCVSADLPGTCQAIPQVCPDIFIPVCGCDGKTYPNDCQRLAAQVGLDHKGACQPTGGGQGATCGGLAGTPCNKGLFCELSPGSCQVADAAGTCQPVPQICDALAHPVCGCDGKTYGNDCERQAAGVSLDHDGACATTTPPGRGVGSTCGGIADLQCDKGLVCDFPPGMCTTADLGGTCRQPPQVCPDVFIPVCGCDGKTYPNECYRSRTGAPKAHDGACP